MDSKQTKCCSVGNQRCWIIGLFTSVCIFTFTIVVLKIPSKLDQPAVSQTLDKLLSDWKVLLTNQYFVTHYDKLEKHEPEGKVILEHFELKLFEDVKDAIKISHLNGSIEWAQRKQLPNHARIASWWKASSAAVVYKGSITPEGSRDYIEFWNVMEIKRNRLFIRSVRTIPPS